MFHNFENEGRKTAHVTLRSVNKTRVRDLVLEISFLREQRRLIFIKQWRLFNMKTAVLSILFSTSATRKNCSVRSDFLNRYRVFRQPALTLVAGCHFGDLMGARLAVSTAVRSAKRVIIYLLKLLQSFLFGFKWLNLVHQISRCSKKRPTMSASSWQWFLSPQQWHKIKNSKMKNRQKTKHLIKEQNSGDRTSSRGHVTSPPPPAVRVALSATKESVAPPSESQYCDKRRPSLEPRLATLAANCSDSHYLTSKSPRHRYK